MDVVSLTTLAVAPTRSTADQGMRCASPYWHWLGDRSLGEYESPGETTLQVLAGRVRLSAGDDSTEGAAGDSTTWSSHRPGTTWLRSRTPSCC